MWDDAPDAGASAPDRDRDRSAALKVDILREVGEKFASWSTQDQGRVDGQRCGGSGNYAYFREVSAELELPACGAGWLVVPSTFKADERAAFVLAVYTTARALQ